jgi:hypothetical protein
MDKNACLHTHVRQAHDISTGREGKRDPSKYEDK